LWIRAIKGAFKEEGAFGEDIDGEAPKLAVLI
jgi:hypothetical protein